ncbi:18144_t:CDS:1, partial [Gigaspora rosea]
VWAEDEDHVRIAGDGKGHYHGCSGSIVESPYMIIGTGRNSPTDWYWIIVKTEGGIKAYKPEPFNSHSCVCVSGTVRDVKISGYPIDTIDNCDKH